MNENEFDLTAQAWLADGPTRMSDDAVLSALEEIHTTRQRRAGWRRSLTPVRVLGRQVPALPMSAAVAIGAAAIVLFAVAAVILSSRQGIIQGPAAPSPMSPPSGPSVSGGMWPQSTLEEVRAAQVRADAGDAGASWQTGARLVEGDPNNRIELQLTDRFIHEVLGWESYKLIEGGEFSDWPGAQDGWVEGSVSGQQFIRCATNATNARYPGESCAPTVDDLRYEWATVDIGQPDRQGRDGIWVVTGWTTGTYTQADPGPAETEARGRLEAFLAARVAGAGAEGYVQGVGPGDVPLLYATASGARYERSEIRLVDGPWWPAGSMRFSIRLLADGGATVVEQEITADRHGQLWLDSTPTTENGQPVPLSFTSSDGEVSVSAPSTWKAYFPGGTAGETWFGILGRDGELSSERGERIELVDPVAYDEWCWGRAVPEGADAVAAMVQADPNLEASAPVRTRIGGLDALSMDVALAPGGTLCTRQEIEIARWIHALQPGDGLRLRLYLVDLPAGMPPKTLAITVVAPEERFDAYAAETAPIIESIRFHPGRGDAVPTVAP